MKVTKPFRSHVKTETKQFAIDLRQKMTHAELVLWEQVRKKRLGFRFRKQSIILGWIADFYCPSTGVVIELDGGYHSTNRQQIKDKKRDSVMSKHGFIILRFPNEEVLTNLDSVLSAIRNTCKEQEALVAHVSRPE